MSLPKLSLLIFLFFMVKINSDAKENFDVRQHLCTVTRYHVAKDISQNSFIPSIINDYENCKPIHLNLLARHGTRAPTKKKLKQLEDLSNRLQDLLRSVEEGKKSLHNIPAWLSGWKSPWKGKYKGGELISEGEAEMYDLGIRVSKKFPELFKEEYHPDIYPIKATQISRASASAVAFGMGLFSGKGNLGLGRHRAFAVTSESRANDTMLRFHDCCQNYTAFKKSQEPIVKKLKEPLLNEIAQELAKRWGLNFTTNDTSSLWELCKLEASLLNSTDQACALFNASQVDLLEWADDVELFILKGYGNSLNYRMGVRLLEDVIQSMENAINASKGGRSPGSYEMARLRFAHAETLLPFSCLIGLFLDGPGLFPGSYEMARLSYANAETRLPFSCLPGMFLDGSEFKLVLREHPLQRLPKPPQKRIWRGSTVAPFAGNNMLVLYSCNNSSKYFVQVLHNEHPIPVPGCENSDVCPFEVFKERIAAPHLKHNYEALCNMESNQNKTNEE